MALDNRSAERDHIFISYRRDDARGASGRIYDWLRIGFGCERVFRDVHSIGVGKWRDKINDALARSVVCVAVIGPRWANDENVKRLHDTNDMVRHELVSALNAKELTLVPTLVEGAEVPDITALPAVLRPLLDSWNARTVTENGWEDDIRRMIAEIAEATGLPVGPDLDTLIRDARAAQRRVAELEQVRHLQTDQMKALRRTVDELTRKLAESSGSERPGLAAAFAALAQGDSLTAEDAFEREYEAQAQSAEEARRTMAEAARNVANLALLRDVKKAVSFYRKALEVEPEHAETARMLGHALILLGDLKEAKDAFSQSIAAAIAKRDPWGEMAAQMGLGDVLKAAGDLSTAHDAYIAASRLVEQGLKGDRANTQWQRDLAVGQTKIGDVLMAQGDRRAALAAYRKVLAIAEELAKRDRANTVWQRDLAVSHQRIGDVLVAQADGMAALAAYGKALAIVEALAERDRANTEWQRDLVVGHTKIGDVLMAHGDRRAALAAYRKVVAVAEALAGRDHANTEWQRDLALSYERIGDVLLTQGDDSAALATYRKALAAREALVERDPANTEWLRDLSVSCNKIGDVLIGQKDGRAALAAFRKGLQIADALAAHDRANTEWQHDLSISYERIGDVLAAQGDGPGALATFRKGLEIRDALAKRDLGNAQRQADVAIFCAKLGMLDYGQSVDARRNYLHRGREILRKLKTAGRLMPDQDWTEWFEQRLEQLPPSEP